MDYRTLNSQLIVADYERTYPWIVRGEGALLYDDAGRPYLDASGCTASNSFRTARPKSRSRPSSASRSGWKPRR